MQVASSQYLVHTLDKLSKYDVNDSHSQWSKWSSSAGLRLDFVQGAHVAIQ